MLCSSSPALCGGGFEMLSDSSRFMSGNPLEKQSPSKNLSKVLRNPFRGFCVQGSQKRSPSVCDNNHYYLEEAERQTTMTGNTTAQGKGNTTTTMTRMTATAATMHDLFQERKSNENITTTFKGIIKPLTDSPLFT